MNRSVRGAMHRVARGLNVVACVALGWLALSAHVGTNQVVFEGQAGGYPVRVIINPPGVVPAQVQILVRVLEGTPTRVSVRAAQWNVGTKGAPPAEQAAVVPGEAGLWAHDLWIMTASTYAVYVTVDGPAGNGSLVVPLQTSATRTLGMTPGMTAILGVLGILLVVGVLTIVGAATREASLAAGEQPSVSRRRTARIATASTAAMLGLGLFGGSKWWQSEELAYRRRMLQPIPMEASVKSVDSERVLTIAIKDSLWLTNRSTPIMPDHGKLMHLFLIRADDESAMAHLHPLRVSPDSFVTRLPSLAEGRYLLFGDLLFQSGAQRTLVDTIDLPVAPVVVGESGVRPSSASAGVPAFDRDDAWGRVTPVALGAASPLGSGGSVTVAADAPSAALRAGRDLRLLVTVREADGSPSVLEPYMGMGGHAMVLRRDAGVFMHLHPMGTASMTAQAQLVRRERGDTAMLDSTAIAQVIAAAEANSMPGGADHPSMPMAAVPLSFPFAFPTEGAYRVFVQLKRKGVVETAAFDVTIASAAKVSP